MELTNISSSEDLLSRFNYSSNSFSALRLFDTASIVDYYYTPFLCFVGVLGNILSVIVFCFNSNHRNLSSSYYLSALAISDTGFLSTLFALWLDRIGYGLLSTNFGCKFIMYSGQVTCLLSVWLTVAFTVERFFAVCSPLLRPSVCTKSKAKKVIFGLTTFALISFSYVLFIAQVEERLIPNQDTYESNIIGQNEKISQVPLSRTSYNNVSSLDDSNGCLEVMTGQGVGCQNQRVALGVTLGRVGEGDNEIQENTEPFAFTQTDALPMEIGSAFIHSENSFERNSSKFSNLSKRIVDEENINLNISDIEGSSFRTFLCTVPLKYTTISIVANYLDTLITLIIPFCLISFFNMRIAVCVWKLKDQRKNILAVSAVSKINSKRSQHQKGTHGVKDYFNHIIQSGKSGEEQQPADQVNVTRSKQTWRKSRMEVPTSGSINNKSPSRELDAVALKKSNDQSSPFQQMDLKETDPSSRETTYLSPVDQTSGTLNIENSPGSSHSCQKQKNLTSSLDGGLKTYGVESPQLTTKTGCKQSEPLTTSFAPTNNSNGVGSRWGISKNNVSLPVSDSSSATETRVTKMLLLVSTTFLVLNLPSHALRCASFLQTLIVEGDVENHYRLQALQQLSNILLFNTNFAVNFILYCLSGRNFRKSLWNIIFGTHKRKSFHWKSGKSTATVRRNIHFGSNPNDINESIALDENTEILSRKNISPNFKDQTQECQVVVQNVYQTTKT